MNFGGSCVSVYMYVAYKHRSAHVSVEAKGDIECPLLPLCVIPIGQGLSLNPELG